MTYNILVQVKEEESMHRSSSEEASTDNQTKRTLGEVRTRPLPEIYMVLTTLLFKMRATYSFCSLYLLNVDRLMEYSDQ